MNLLLFDIDGTLTATNRDDDRLFLESVSEVAGQEIEAEGWEAFPHVTDMAIARELLTRAAGRPAKDREILAVREIFIRKWVKAVETREVAIEPIPGARELLAEARSRRDCVVAIVTGGWSPTAILKLQQAGLDVNGLVIVTSDDDDTRSGIVSSAIIFAAANRGTPGFSFVTLIGDGLWDLRAARECGAGFLGLASDAEHGGRLLAEGAAAVIPNYRDAAKFWSGVDQAIAQQRAAKGR
ncbi:MAG: HAD family hydrolase [Opitutaceae bacterium]